LTLAVAGAAVALVGFLGAGPAGASPAAARPIVAAPIAAATGSGAPTPRAATPVTDAVLSRAAATAQINPAAVVYYERTYRVSANVAKERLASQLMGQGLQDSLQARYGDAIAGVSFDNTTGQWIVDAQRSVPSSGIAAEFAHTGLARDYRLSWVRYSHSDVTGASVDIASRLKDQIARGVVAVSSGGGAVTVTVSQSATRADRVAVAAAERSAASTAPVTQAAVAGSLLARTTAVSCSGTSCNTLIGGDAYSGTGGSCTMSWYGSLKVDGVTEQLMMTAGHCTLDLGGAGSTVSTYDLAKTVSFGNQYLGSFGGDGDWGYIYVTTPPPSGLDPGLGRPFGGYVNLDNKGIVGLAHYYSSGVPSSGTVICHNGEGSVDYLGNGTQCGTAGGMTSVNVNNDGTTTTLDNMLQVNSTEECFGDSGGPWDLSSNATAVGIQSSASIPTGANCGTTAYATPISNAIQAYSAYNLVLYGS
jgi:hypothetical protein